MKKISILLFSFLLVAVVFEQSKNNQDEITTFRLDKEKGFISYPTSQREKEIAKISDKVVTKKKRPSRSLASVKKSSPDGQIQKNVKLTLAGRKLVGNTAKFKGKESLKFNNRISKDWKKSAAKSLLNMQSVKTSVILKKEESLIKISNNGSATFYETVLVSYINENNSTSSFHALIDSETGVISKTWNHSKLEGRAKITLSPGILN